jgi:ferrous iron transport protein B
VYNDCGRASGRREPLQLDDGVAQWYASVNEIGFQFQKEGKAGVAGVTSAVRKIALVGYPNVGKSAAFAQLTSLYVTVSNYPGTTVDIFRGQTEIGEEIYEIVDTPGIYGLQAESEDERVALEILEREKPDLIVQVGDGKNLRRTLILTAQLSQLQTPLVLLLNMADECRRQGIQIDRNRLSEKLGIPVFETVATTGEGFSALRGALDSQARCDLNGHVPSEWARDILADVQSQGAGKRNWARWRTWGWAAATVAGAVVHLHNYVAGYWGMASAASLLSSLLATADPGGAEGYFAQSFTILGAYLLPVLLPFLLAVRLDEGFSAAFGVSARRFPTGLPILVVSLSLVYQLVGVLGAQVLVDLLEDELFGAVLVPAVQAVLPAGFFFDLLVGEYGLLSVGISYAVAIVLPVIVSFFIAFSFLEDSGYLPRLAVLSDRIFRSMGLNGKAFLPMVLGLGCVTMATMTTRILNSRKERLIATVLLALGVPCSAQLGVILGIVAGISPLAVLLVFGTISLQIVLVGLAMSRLFPGRRSDFMLEVPPIRFPMWRNILKKTLLRVSWFLKEAVPLFILGTLVLFLLDRLRLLGSLVSALEPAVTRLLDLPANIATVFLMGFLRRDYGAAGMFDMAREGLLTTPQIVVGVTVLTLFVPCIANFFVIIREQGLRNALIIVVFITFYAVLVGTLLNFVIRSLELMV